jgi:hypothetical protein
MRDAGGESRWCSKVADRLLSLGDEAGAKRGHMFGHPALYARGKMAACAYGGGIGLKLPAERVVELLESGRGEPFQPYGKSRMREWVHLRAVSTADVEHLADLIVESLAFVAARAGGGSG